MKESTEMLVNENKNEEIKDDGQTMDELCERFRQKLSERQELRRKNFFLQKKMVEFFKKRKMDHALKEDPKGLDLEGKYLKRLHDLQKYKQLVKCSCEDIEKHHDALQDEHKFLEEQLKTKEKEFHEKQKNVAGTVLLKTKKHISSKAVENFLASQSANAEEICRQRFLEVKEKKRLEEKEARERSLESLGKGMSRADFELLNFQHENVVQQCESKKQEVVQWAEKVRKVMQQIRAVEVRAEQVSSTLQHQILRKKDSDTQLEEVRTRVQNLKKQLTHLRREHRRLKDSTAILTDRNFLRDYDATQEDIEDAWSRLDKFHISWRSERLKSGERRDNTPAYVESDFLENDHHG